jgi:hypothetical protein
LWCRMDMRDRAYSVVTNASNYTAKNHSYLARPPDDSSRIHRPLLGCTVGGGRSVIVYRPPAGAPPLNLCSSASWAPPGRRGLGAAELSRQIIENSSSRVRVPIWSEGGRVFPPSNTALSPLALLPGALLDTAPGRTIPRTSTTDALRPPVG